MATAEQNEELRRRREEDIMAAQFANGLASEMKQIQQMTMPGSRVSKSAIIDPRKFLKGYIQPPPNNTVQNIPQNVPVNTDQSLLPRVNLIPMPKGIPASEAIPPEMLSQKPVVPIAPVISTPEEKNTGAEQLELNFNRQATLNDLYNHLDALNYKLDTILLTLNKIDKNATLQLSGRNHIESSGITESDKKKSNL